MTMLTKKSEQKRLDRPAHAGGQWLQTSINSAFETRSPAQVVWQVLEPPYSLIKRVDQSAEQHQHGENGTILGKYRLRLPDTRKTRHRARMAPSLTLFFIVEPPNYQYMACYLAASIRKHMPEEVELIGYCPGHRLAEVDPAVVETLRRMKVEIRTFEAKGHFDPAYPHGNKILACLEPRDTDYSGFMDSDILMIRKNSIGALIKDGHVSASPAASMYWAPQKVWKTIYGSLDMPVPEERVMLMRDKRKPMIPYFSSGFVLFSEAYRTNEGQSFPQVWLDTAQRVDKIPDLEKKRPYLDQMSLPLAIRRAGLEWNILPEEHHYILGGQLRGEPFPEEQEIFTVHYRKWEVLKEVGLAKHGYENLKGAVGTRQVRMIFKQKVPVGITAFVDDRSPEDHSENAET